MEAISAVLKALTDVAIRALCAAALVWGTTAAQSTGGPWQAGGYLDVLAQGKKLSAEDAENLEVYLRTNPDDVAARGKLIAYYFLNVIRQPRLTHILWMIEHHPESEITAQSSLGIGAAGFTFDTAADKARAKEMWAEQLLNHENDARVLGSAYVAIGGDDLAIGEDLLKRLRGLEPGNSRWAKQLAGLYAGPIIRAGDPQGAAAADAELAERFKRELETSTDGMVVARAAAILIRSASTRGQDAAVAEFGSRLRKRAEELGAGLGEVGSMPDGVTVLPLPLPRVITRAGPVYPPLAKQARIQGTVRLKMTIGKDGHVKDVQLISGHPLLVPAAQTAVKQWLYTPVLRDGEPVEVQSQVDLNFDLEDGGPPSALEEAPKRTRLSNIPSAVLLQRVSAEYPPLAKQARIQGTVRFAVIIGKDGHVQNLQLVSGHPLLVPAALEAVRQWVYRPTLLNGEPVEVITVADVKFALDGEPGQ